MSLILVNEDISSFSLISEYYYNYTKNYYIILMNYDVFLFDRQFQSNGLCSFCVAQMSKNRRFHQRNFAPTRDHGHRAGTNIDAGYEFNF